jgi:hypothetical protein
MSSAPNVVEGIVSNSDGTVLENVNVTVNNTTKGESHTYGDSGFNDLKTNSSGEWSANLGSFDNGWILGDNITYSASHGTYGSDSDTTTVVSGGRQNLNLVLSTEAVNRANTAINNKGETVDLYSLNEDDTVYRDNYGDIDAESFTSFSITASIQVQSDDTKLMEWGLVEAGEALGFFKAKNTVKRGDKIRVPATSGSWWTIMKAVPLRSGGALHHYECVLTRVSDDTVSLAVAGAGTTVAFTLTSTRALGSSLSGTNGAVGRVMTIGTTQLASNAKVYLDGMRVDSDDLTISYAATLITITFTSQKVWDEQVVTVDYAT